MSSEREILRKLSEAKTSFGILPDKGNDRTIVRSEHHPISTADIPNIQEDIVISQEVTLDSYNVEELLIFSRAVMSNYQRANKWLDSIKEILLIDFNLPYFSKIVHDQAHAMPGRFDSFGDILHTLNIKVPYPSTEEMLTDLSTVEDSIKLVLDLIKVIITSLLDFKNCVESNEDTFALSSMCDPLVEDLQGEFEFYLRANNTLSYYNGNLSQWDMNINDIYISMEIGSIE